MTNSSKTYALALALSIALAGCAVAGAAKKGEDASDTGPKPIRVEAQMDANNFEVDHPERFPLVTAAEQTASPELNVTGVVSPDVSRQVGVPSLTSGRVIEIDARLGDQVQQGQLLFKLRSTDVAGAYSDYRQAVKNEDLTKLQLQRAKTLFDAGAYPRAQLETAQNAEDDAIVVVDTTLERLRLLGLDPDNPTGTVEVHAPVSGIITDQQITISSGVQALTPPTLSPFPTCPMSGSSATCMRTTWRRSTSANTLDVTWPLIRTAS